MDKDIDNGSIQRLDNIKGFASIEDTNIIAGEIFTLDSTKGILVTFDLGHIIKFVGNIFIR